jgi:hypothetical protein
MPVCANAARDKARFMPLHANLSRIVMVPGQGFWGI